MTGLFASTMLLLRKELQIEMRTREIGAGCLGQCDVETQKPHLYLETVRGAGHGRTGGERRGGFGSGHDSADGKLDAVARGGRGILAKLLVVCQLRLYVRRGGTGET